MSENPYSAPSEELNAKISSVGIPALLLLVLLLLTIFVDAWYVIMFFLDLQNAAQGMGWSFWMVRDWTFPIGLSIVIAAHCVIFAAMVSVLRRRRYKLSVIGCIVSLIPVLSPGIILGFPLAIWCLVLLSRPSVRSEFSSN
ncbi:hypothetical protein LOC67_26965 [Stieleria sp. JC731]|uniref:hypothetical protein n=1 Tax=Stieleria sp. JC731 TaxID=2894195 RepID=UPI001E40ADEA|nr:hypothetical protein [Stieleria sp. JC731]MCC9602243.1 hypothetical protein [Stieleria sp. JC731]MCC9604212.1 hypothetical protein [Stieleria sp. JC731]